MRNPTRTAGQAPTGPRLRPARCLTAAGALAFTLVGCSYGIPSLMPEDDITTGSVSPRAAVLDPTLDGEDLRRAKGALAVALDPQGNGRTVKWDNPESGAAGSITPDSSPFVQSDLICRHFTALVARRTHPDRALRGTACKPSADEWELREVKPVGKPA